MLLVGAKGYLWYINYGFIVNTSVFSTHQCSFPRACSFFMCFSITFCSFRVFFKPFSQQFIPIAGSECFSKVALTIWGTSPSKQWSVVFGERDNGTVSSTHCSKVLFRDLELVIFCWRSVVLDCWSFVVIFGVISVVCVLVVCQLSFYVSYFYFNQLIPTIRFISFGSNNTWMSPAPPESVITDCSLEVVQPYTYKRTIKFFCCCLVFLLSLCLRLLLELVKAASGSFQWRRRKQNK